MVGFEAMKKQRSLQSEKELCFVCGAERLIVEVYTIEQKWKTMKMVCRICERKKNESRQTQKTT